MRDIVIFTRQFSTMINAGLPLVQALDILAQQSENPALRDTTRQVVFDVESGHTVADALRKHPKAFTELYVNMVAAGEAGGILDTILHASGRVHGKERRPRAQGEGRDDLPGRDHERGGDRHHGAADLRDPVFQNMFAEREHRAAAADAHRHRPVEVPQDLLVGRSAAGLFAACSMFKRYYATPDGKLAIDRMVLQAPVLGDVLRKSAVSRFTRTLGTLIGSGVIDSRRARDHGQDRRQPGDPGRDHGIAGQRSPAARRSPRRSRRATCSRRW